MKTLVIVLFSLCTFTSAQEFVAGKIIRRPSRNGRAADLAPATTCPKTQDIATFCVSDDECKKDNKFFTCINGAPKKNAAGNADAEPESCGANNYCIGDPGAQLCSAQAGPRCASDPKYCKNPGFVADPSNCQIYYQCYMEGATLKENVIQCPTGSAFNPAGPNNLKCQISGSCVKATCTQGLAAEWRPMNYYNYTNNRMAAKCVDGKVNGVNVCPGGLSLDTTYTPAPRCSIKCVSNYQRGAYIADKSMYYQCLMGTASLVRCDSSKIFDQEKLDCVSLPATKSPLTS